MNKKVNWEMFEEFADLYPLLSPWHRLEIRLHIARMLARNGNLAGALRLVARDLARAVLVLAVIVLWFWTLETAL